MVQSAEMNNRRFLSMFIVAGLLNNILEGFKMRINSGVIQSIKTYPEIHFFQYGLVWNNTLIVFCGFLAIVFVDIGYAFVFYVFLLESVWRLIHQLNFFKFSIIHILQFFISFIFAISFGIKSVTLYHSIIFLNFRFIGANNKLIIAFVIRRICVSIKKAFYMYLIFSFLLIAVPDYVPNNLKTVPKFLTLNIIMIMFFDRRENEEKRWRELCSLVLWGVLDLQFLVKNLSRLIFTSDTYANPRQITFIIIISTYIGAKSFDLYFCGSGLREFLKEKHFNDRVRLN